MPVNFNGNVASSIYSNNTSSKQGSQEPRHDDFLGMRFWIDIGQIYVAQFRECSALTIETETFEYAEGGLNYYTHKLPVRTKYGNITLKRGIDTNRDLLEWYMHTVKGTPQRLTISIIMYGSQQQQLRKWDLQRAYPVKWIGPDLRTESGAIAVETLEIAHDGLLSSSITSGPPELATSNGSFLPAVASSDIE